MGSIKSNRLLQAVLLFLPMIWTSCESGYRPVDADHVRTGKGIKRLHGKIASIMVITEAHIKNDSGSFFVTLMIPRTTRAAPFTLSNVKVGIAAVGATAGHYTFQRIDFSHSTPSSVQRVSLKTITDVQTAEATAFEMTDDGRYVITYFFSGSKMRHYPKKLRVSIDAEVSGSGDREGFHESIDFKRFSSFSPYH